MIETIGTGLVMVLTYKGGSALWSAAAKAYAKKRETDVRLAEVAETKASREDDITRDFAVDAIAERKATMEKVDQQAAEITRLSVAVARCEEKHVASEFREKAQAATIAEQAAEIATLKSDLSFTRQLADRQRQRIDELEARDAARDAEVADLRVRFDAVVKAAMLRDSIPPGVAGQ